MDGEKAAISKATTTFVTDANVVATTVPNPVYTPSSLYLAASDNYIQDIVAFLQKPQLIKAGSFASTDTVSSFAADAVAFPFFYSTIPMWQEKLRGFFGIRMDLSFRLVVNATRFQQGRYMLLWKPFGGSDSSSAKNLAITAGHVMTLTQRTQMPHAEIDINCDTEIEFKIPFSSQYNFCHVRSITAGNQYNSLGVIQIYPYVALKATAGALTCSYSLYVSAEKIELISVAAPQSGRFTTTRKGKNETNLEQDSANMGPISSIMAKVNAATSILSGVPLLSSYSQTAGWMADVVGRTAAVFGYSRPVNLVKADRMTKEIFPYIASSDGPDNSFPFSLSYKNELGSMTGISPTDLDEMDFTFLCTIPVYDRIISWIPANPAGLALASWGVGPHGTSTPSTIVNTRSMSHFPPYRYVSNYFKFWRGTMVYKFKIVKTEFHSGRLSFTFTPRTTSQNLIATPSGLDLPYIHREIVDIRIDNEVTFKVPFVSDTPWKPCFPTSNDDIHLTGIFTINVVDALVAPETVTQEVSIILEISMAPDVEFAVPIINPYRTPFYGAVPQMGAFDGGSKPENNTCNEITTSLGAMMSSNDNYTSALLCIGESISSVRKYLRRASPFIFTSALAATVGPRLTVIPFGTTMFSQNGVQNTTPTVAADIYTAFSSLYLYSRGSVRLKYISDDIPQSRAGDDVSGIPVYFAPKFLYKLLSQNPGSPANLIVWDSGGTITYADVDVTTLNMITSGRENQEIQIPHYHRLPIRNNYDHAMNTQFPYSTHVGTSTGAATELFIERRLVSQNQSIEDNVPTRLYRSTADDCTFSYFLSVPPVTVNSESF